MKTLETRKTAKPLASVQFEMIVDNFAGAGGASMGIEGALGRAVDVAVNHDPIAIRIHEANHPNTKHYTQDIWEVDPLEVCQGRPVGLAWFSPDCKHFSRAKGGKPRDRRIRSLAWVVVKWAKLVKPRVIMMENVPEFKDWGPLGSDSKPIPNRKGETYRRWLGMIKRAGYQVDDRMLVAADYGAPTIRKRFFLIARCDGQPITWPERTHYPRKDAAADLFGQRRTWRSAAECIDWELPCPSIFERKRPLAEATQRRIALGIKKFILEAKEPFIVTCNHGGDGFRGQSPTDPLMTLTGSRDAHGLVVPFTAGVGGRAGQSLPRDPQDPAGTITAKADSALVAPFLTQYHGPYQGKPSVRGSDLTDPLKVQDTQNRYGLVQAFINKHFTGVVGSKAQDPLGTVTAQDHNSLTCAFLKEDRGQSIGQNPARPLGTTTQTPHHGLTAAFLSKFRGTCQHGQDAREPMATITGGGFHLAEVRAFLVKYFSTGGQLGNAKDPMATLTAKHRMGLVEVLGTDWQIVDIGLRMLTPRELLRAQMGKYATDYVLVGNQSQQVAGIGNSVCPEVAEALVKANVVIQRVAAIRPITSQGGFMGCDIHLFVEFKKDGKWQTADVWEKSQYSDEVGKLRVPSHFEFYGDRAYYLFSKLSDCGRCVDNKPIIEPRGFPADASQEVNTFRENYGADGHSDSWITFSELQQHDWKSVENYPDSWRVCLERLWQLKFNKNVNENEIRVVFWFDN